MSAELVWSLKIAFCVATFGMVMLLVGLAATKAKIVVSEYEQQSRLGIAAVALDSVERQLRHIQRYSLFGSFVAFGGIFLAAFLPGSFRWVPYALLMTCAVLGSASFWLRYLIVRRVARK